MDINVKKTFRVSSRNLFVIVTDARYNSLVSMRTVFDKRRKISFPIFSIEWVKLLDMSMPGITVRYETDQEALLLEEITKDSLIVE